LADAFLDGLDVEGIHSARDVIIVAAVPLTVAVNLGGQALYSGFAAAAEVEWRAHRAVPSLVVLARCGAAERRAAHLPGRAAGRRAVSRSGGIARSPRTSLPPR